MTETMVRNTSFFRVLRSETIKFTSVPSTPVLILCTMAVMVGFAALNAWAIGSFFENAPGNADMAAGADEVQAAADSVAAGGVVFAQLIMGSLAVLVMSSEFATGMSRATYAAVPKRYPVFLAKALLVAAVSFLVAAVSILIAYLAIGPITDHYGIPLDFASEGFQRSLWVSAAYVGAISLIGFALGSLLRNSAGGIVTLAGLTFVAPIAFALLPGELVAKTARFFPDSAYTNLLAAQTAPDALEKWQSGLVLGLWAAVPLAVAGIVAQRRDV
ncbi:ABC transporter permease [Arthrobacter sp. KK5.5]|uniref:ABC transporter permease n=1 Tax=Arthrobacter sp. KK5.5 TaxID=3373084 RepID=UPI003EE524C3